jgi:hypothetical protein
MQDQIFVVLGQLHKRGAYYTVAVDVCPARHGNRKGVVEKANHAAAQRWWRTLPDTVSVAEAQASLDRRAAALDGRRRVRDGQKLTDPPSPMPAPVAALVLEHLAHRDNRNTATNRESRWLFPGATPASQSTPQPVRPRPRPRRPGHRRSHRRDPPARARHARPGRRHRVRATTTSPPPALAVTGPAGPTQTVRTTASPHRRGRHHLAQLRPRQPRKVARQLCLGAP